MKKALRCGLALLLVFCLLLSACGGTAAENGTPSVDAADTGASAEAAEDTQAEDTQEDTQAEDTGTEDARPDTDPADDAQQESAQEEQQLQETASDADVFAATAGTWRVDGEEGTASIVMDGQGNYTAYYASGALESEGTLEYTDEYGDGNGRYDLYDGTTGEWLNGFYFDSDTQIHFGNGEETQVYLLEQAAQ